MSTRYGHHGVHDSKRVNRTRAQTDLRDNRGVGTVLLLVIAVAAMQAEALEFTTASAALRNLVSGLLVLSLGVRLLSPGGTHRRVGMAFWMACFAGWVVIRVVYDSGLALIPLVLVLWFPLTFAIGYSGTGLSRRALTIVAWFGFFSSIAYMLVSLGDGVRGPQAINAIFYPLLCLPFVLARGRGVVTLLALGTIAIATLSSEKRTAVIAFVAAVIVALLVQAAASRRMKIKGMRLRTVSVLVIVGIFGYRIVAARVGIDVLEKFSQVAEDDGSGRGTITNQVLDLIGQMPFGSLLVGYGQDAVVEEIGVSAHNDFLEVTYDFGVVALFFLVMVLVAGFSFLRRLIASGSPMVGGMAGALVLFIVMGMLSHVVFVPTYIALLSYFWGSVLAGEHANLDKEGELDPEFPGVEQGKAL